MEIRVKEDSVEVTGYVNAIERNSKPLHSRIGQFVERVCKGCFKRAIGRNDNIRLLLNHNPERELGSTKKGNLELKEDNIGLHARATITDPEVVKLARNGDLVGWSFGFRDTPDGVLQGIDEETKLPLRRVRDMNLEEVSILDRTRTPAYEGTLVTVRSDDEVMFYSEPLMDDLEIREENQPKQHEDVEESKPIDYSQYEKMIEDMREERKNVEIS